MRAQVQRSLNGVEPNRLVLTKEHCRRGRQLVGAQQGSRQSDAYFIDGNRKRLSQTRLPQEGPGRAAAQMSANSLQSAAMCARIELLSGVVRKLPLASAMFYCVGEFHSAAKTVEPTYQPRGSHTSDPSQRTIGKIERNRASERARKRAHAACRGGVIAISTSSERARGVKGHHQASERAFWPSTLSSTVRSLNHSAHGF